jgi:hypothetical protein
MAILNRVAYLDFKLLQDSIGPDTIGLLAEGHMFFPNGTVSGGLSCVHGIGDKL